MKLFYTTFVDKKFLELQKRKYVEMCNRVFEYYTVKEDVKFYIPIDESNSSSVELKKGEKICTWIVFKYDDEKWYHNLLFKIYCLFHNLNDIQDIEVVSK